MMNKPVSGIVRWRRAVVGAGIPLLLMIGGCEPLSAESVQGFLAEFARGALAAWLL